MGFQVLRVEIVHCDHLRHKALGFAKEVGFRLAKNALLHRFLEPVMPEITVHQAAADRAFELLIGVLGLDHLFHRDLEEACRIVLVVRDEDITCQVVAHFAGLKDGMYDGFREYILGLPEMIAEGKHEKLKERSRGYNWEVLDRLMRGCIKAVKALLDSIIEDRPLGGEPPVIFEIALEGRQ